MSPPARIWKPTLDCTDIEVTEAFWCGQPGVDIVDGPRSTSVVEGARSAVQMSRAQLMTWTVQSGAGVRSRR